MVPTVEEFAEAIVAADPSPNEIALLQWHYRAPGRTLTAVRLSELMEWGGQSANAHYGRLAGRVSEHLDWQPSDVDSYWTTMKVSSLVLGRRDNGEFEWTLRPEVAAALEELGGVVPEGGAEVEKPSRHSADINVLPGGRRVWIKSFWGFDTQNESYLGFTREADRERFLRLYQAGDLVLIYGAVAEETERDDRRQALGFIEVEPTRVSDVDRSSPEAIEDKRTRGWEDKWIYAVPVKRAWVVERRIQIKHIATSTYKYARARAIATQGEILTDIEAQAALRLPVKAVNAYLEPPIIDSKTIAPLERFLSPSQGIKPSFGQRSTTTEDGEHFLYLMKMSGDLSALLGRDSFSLVKKTLVKVGYSNDPRRLTELNSGIPGNSKVKWQAAHVSKPFENARAAFDAEVFAKKALQKVAESLGGEFFLGLEDKIESAFNSAAARTAFIIAAP